MQHEEGTHMTTTATAATDVKEAGRVGRRGILAVAAAAVASIAAKQTVAAGVDGDVVLGASNTTTATTGITNTTTSDEALFLDCPNGTNGWGLDARGSGFGVLGRSNVAGGTAGGAGVYGETNRTNSYGVSARNTSSSGSVALYANIASSAAGYAAVATTTGVGSVGVYGSSTQYTGVYGSSGGQTGTLGVSQNGNGVYGVSTGTNVAGVYGTATAAGSNSYGIEGVAGASGTGAGKFTGLVLVQGNHVVTGTKSAAVPHPDGSLRLLYCVEAPEAWFEDFGEGKLAAGRAEVRLDADFLAVVDTSTMHAFVMPHDPSQAVGVTQRSARGFTAEVDAGAMAARGRRMTDINGTFSYRVVAKRKDIKAERLAKFVPPPANARPTPLAAAPPTPPPAPDTKER